MERTVTLFENGKAIFALKSHIDTRNNNLEGQLADFIMQMGNGKGMIKPMRVANRIRIMCNRHSTLDIIEMIKHPDEWRINATRPLSEDEISKIKDIKLKAQEASALVRV